jgi:hypothetical protein
MTLKPNQSVHITIKEPPLTIRSIGIFDDASIIIPIIERFVNGTTPKSAEFISNSKEEVYLLLAQSKILTVSVENDVYTITLRKDK